MSISHRNISYLSIAILSSTILIGSLYHGFALPQFTNSDIVLTAVCPPQSSPISNWLRCTEPGGSLESIIVTSNGVYTVYATTRAQQKIGSTTIINNIDKTRPVAKSVSYSPHFNNCTKNNVTATVTFFDGLNTNRQKDRISGFDGGQNGQQISINDYGQYPWCKNGGCTDTHIQKIKKTHTFSSNGTRDITATDLAGNTSIITQINNTKVDWIKSTSPSITNLVLTSGLTGQIPFSFDISDPSESDPNLAIVCKGQIMNWSINITVNNSVSTLSGTGKAGDHITGMLNIPGIGDYTVGVTLIDIVGNTTVLYGAINSDGSTETSNTPITTIQSSESRVKILGSIGGQGAYDSVYSVGSKFDSSLFASTLNQIRKNIALLTRNIDLSVTPKKINNIVFIKNQTLQYSNTSISSDFPSDTDSLVIIGGDLIIDSNISNTSSKPKGIIVMKNEVGQGGNIYISGSVKNIQSSIFTEGSVFSGDSPSNIYNATHASLAFLPTKQLYIQGSLISRNTILGGLSGICTYNTTGCTADNAYQYDLNYFRNFQSGSILDRAYKDATLDTYSLIIERDTRISNDPPPGWDMR